MKKIIAFVLVAILFTGLGVFVAQRQTEPQPAATSAVGDFFAKSMADPSGTMHSFSQWKGRPLVVNFWATWCAPCVDEMPELSALQKEFGGGIQILGIGIDTPSNIRQFNEKYNIGYPLYTGGMDGAELARKFGNQAGGLPFTVLISRNGEVKKTYIGRLKMEELKKDLQALQM